MIAEAQTRPGRSQLDALHTVPNFRDDPRHVGGAAAQVGALLGAWLGHNAAAGLTAIITTIIGAAAGTNLVLIALEITLELSNRRRNAAVTLPPASTRAAV